MDAFPCAHTILSLLVSVHSDSGRSLLVCVRLHVYSIEPQLTVSDGQQAPWEPALVSAP